jgi:AcrR family transcriptional regulator
MTDRLVIKKARRRPDERPSEILDAALGLFAERGFAGTRMEDVAAKAGLSKGALYLYFPDKVSLLVALVQQTVGGPVSHAIGMIAAHQGPVAPLIPAILNLIAEKLETTNLATLIKLVMSESRAHPELGKAYFENVIGKVFPAIEGLIKRGVSTGEFRAVDPAMMVRSFIAPMLLAALWKSVIQPLGVPGFSASDLAHHHADLILRGLKP